uniref:Uncharacterized protein n=1 Tax=Brassica oleracea TaxID=3712 RepID=A0A3P6GTN2_BRAOL|nr:unnamed protein product [Brassica oleracea]
MGSSVGAFLETHVSEENAAQVAAGCLQGLCFDTNYLEVAGGRIWIVWDPTLSVVVFQKSAQMVVCGIFDLDTQTSLTVGLVQCDLEDLETQGIFLTWSNNRK